MTGERNSKTLNGSDNLTSLNRTNIINILVLLFFFALIFLMGIVKIWNGDTWWHLKTGEVIVTTRSLPAKDIFSYTGSERRWVHDEWLGEVILYTAYRLGGINGAILFTAAIATLIFFILYLTCRMEGARTTSTVVFLTAAAFAMRNRLTARPEIFGLLLVAIFIYIIRKQFLKNKSPIWLLPLLQLIWVNLHPGALIGAILIFVAISSAAITEFISRLKIKITASSSFSRAIPLIPILFLSLVACLINPYGLHGLTAPIEFAGTTVYLKHIAEWAPVTWNHLSYYNAHHLFAFRFLLLFGAVSFIVLLWRLEIMRPLLFLLTGAMALKAHRFIGIFSLIAAPIAAAEASDALRSIRLPRYVSTAVLITLLPAMVLLANFDVVRNQVYSFGFGTHPLFPTAAVEFLKDKHSYFKGHMYNEYSIGGYIVWILFPDFKVFIDSRTTFYGEEFYKEMIDFESAPTPEKWERLVNKYDINYAVLTIEQKEVSRAISHTGGWTLVYWDDRALIYVGDKPDFSSLIGSYGYLQTNPYNALETARTAAERGGPLLHVVREELERPFTRKDVPVNPIALQALGYLEYKLGNYKRAKYILKMLIKIEPRLAGPHGLLGNIYLREGNITAARLEFQNAAAIKPEYNEILKQIRENKSGDEQRK